MKYQDIRLEAKDGYLLSLRLFDVKKPKGVITILHGMEEHKERYDEFALFLQEHGFAVLTSDMRGHGVDAPILSHIADSNGNKLLISDVDVLTSFVKEKYAKTKYYLIAHSMGTIIARAYLEEHSKEYDKVVLSGYPNPNKMASIGIVLSNILKFFKGSKANSNLLTLLTMGGFITSVKKRETDLDWLSYNKENVQSYLDDPLCGVPFTIGSYHTLYCLVRDISSSSNYKDVSNMPILLISGEDDPCTGGSKGRKDSYSILLGAHFTNIQVITIPHMRHEILNETGKNDVYQKILEFLNEKF